MDVCTGNQYMEPLKTHNRNLHLCDERINRFSHIHRELEDLYKRPLNATLLCHRTNGHVHRSMGTDAMKPLSVSAYETYRMQVIRKSFQKYGPYPAPG